MLRMWQADDADRPTFKMECAECELDARATIIISGHMSAAATVRKVRSVEASLRQWMRSNNCPHVETTPPIVRVSGRRR
jgi:hypothetical protein